MKKPDISTRFCQLTARYGYKRGIRQLQREYDADAFAAFATESRTKINGSRHGQHIPDPASTAASGRWSALHDRTAIEVA